MKLLLLLVLLTGQKDEAIERLPTPNDAVALALADTQAIAMAGGAAELPFMRYVWVPNRTGKDVLDDARAVSATLHYLSRSNQVGPNTRPLPLAGGSVLRIDLRRYVRLRGLYLGDLGDWLATWESFQHDPYFSTLITADMIRLARFDGGVVPKIKVHKTEWKLRDIAPYKGSDGFTYNQKWTEEKVVTEALVTDAKDFAALRLAPLHVDQAAYSELQSCLQTQAPIVHVGTLISRGLATIEDDGLYKLVYGGLYYEFAGITKTSSGRPVSAKQNDELNLYKQLGVNTDGKTLEEFFDALGSDRKAGVFFSKITGRPRQVYWFPSLADDEDPVVYVTRDVRSRDIDILGHAIANLLVFKHQASEIIFVKSNGFPGFALTNGKGDLLRFAADEVVSDHEVPRPFRSTLQSGLSCIRCHRYEDGYRPFSNDVQRLIPVGDVANISKDLLETYDRLKELYRGNAANRLARSRNRYSQAVLAATGPWKRGKGDQTDIVKLLGEQLTAIEHEYKYELVTPEIACRELGFQPPKDKALDLLRVLLPAAPDNKYLVQALGFVPEDFRLAGLLAGIPITRTDWQLSYSTASVRAQRAWADLEAKKVKK